MEVRPQNGPERTDISFRVLTPAPQPWGCSLPSRSPHSHLPTPGQFLQVSPVSEPGTRLPSFSPGLRQLRGAAPKQGARHRPSCWELPALTPITLKCEGPSCRHVPDDGRQR